MRAAPRNPSSPGYATRADLREKGFFVLVSGGGWLIDFSVFNALVYVAEVSPFWANYASSIIGAASAFTLYALHATHARSLPSGLQLVAYVAYQLAAITGFSWLVGWLTAQPALAEVLTIAGLAGAAAPAAKIIATPFNMLVNYLASRIVLKIVPADSRGRS